MGSARRKLARNGRRTTPTVRRAAAEERHEERAPNMVAALRADHPVHFLNVVSSFIGFDEATGMELPPLHLKLADMASDRTELHNALFIGLAALAPRADDRVHARTLADAMSEAERSRLPAWLFALGEARASAAVRSVGDGEADVWFIEAQVAGHRMTAVVGIEPELQLPASLAGTIGQPTDRLSSMVMHPSSPDRVVLGVEPALAAQHVLDALARAERFGVAPAVPFWPEPRPLLRWVAGLATR